MDKQLTLENEETKKAEKKPTERIIKRAITGDREALTELCKSTARSVLFRVSCKVSNQMDAEDIAQEILIRMCQKIGELSDEKAFGGWLNRIINNETSRFITKNLKPVSIISIDEFESDSIDIEEDDRDFLPVEYTLREEDRKMVMDIVKELPERQMETIILYYFENMSITETAEAMGVAKSNVVRQLSIAREKIKREIEKQSKKSGAMYGFALLPIGGLLRNVFRQEAALAAPLSLAPVEQLLSDNSEAPAEASSGSLLTTILFIAAAIIVSGAIVILLFAGNVLDRPDDKPAGQIENAEAVGTVIFYGGDAVYEHLNPKRAVVQAGNIHGELTVISWVITSEDTTTVLYSGEGANADYALTDLSENGEDGEYWVVFALMDTDGGTYTLSRSFIIRRDFVQVQTE